MRTPNWDFGCSVLYCDPSSLSKTNSPASLTFAQSPSFPWSPYLGQIRFFFAVQIIQSSSLCPHVFLLKKNIRKGKFRIDFPTVVYFDSTLFSNERREGENNEASTLVSIENLHVGILTGKIHISTVFRRNSLYHPVLLCFNWKLHFFNCPIIGDW